MKFSNGHLQVSGEQPYFLRDPDSQEVLLIVDTSGSMDRDDRLGLVKRSLEILVDSLADDDTVAIVTYDDSAGVVLAPTPVSERDAILARAEQIKAFRILPKALDPEEEGEPVTPTRKVKRNLMYERFKPLVEEMYDDREEKLLAASAADALG